MYVISIAAGLAGCHPRTLRIYEEEGLLEPVRTEVKKANRLASRSATRVITGEQGAQRSVVIERRVVRRFGNDKRTGT